MTRALYDDGLVRLDDEGLVLRRYYFPLGRPHAIPYARVRGVEERPMGWLSGRARGWGTTSGRVWLPLELRRFRKTRLVALDVGGRVWPAFTPDDPDQVLRILRERVPQQAN